MITPWSFSVLKHACLDGCEFETAVELPFNHTQAAIKGAPAPCVPVAVVEWSDAFQPEHGIEKVEDGAALQEQAALSSAISFGSSLSSSMSVIGLGC